MRVAQSGGKGTRVIDRPNKWVTIELWISGPVG
jgi:hypothetical protein